MLTNAINVFLMIRPLDSFLNKSREINKDLNKLGNDGSLDWINSCVDAHTATNFDQAFAPYKKSAQDVYWLCALLIIFVFGSIIFIMFGAFVEYYRQEQTDEEQRQSEVQMS